MKALVPPAPVGSAAGKTQPVRERRQMASELDSGFAGRTMVSMIGVGALGMLGVLNATQSPLLAVSYFGGLLLGALLLKSQELFVKRVLGPRASNEKNLLSRLPLAVLLPLKYIFIGAVMGILIEYRCLQPVALACGFMTGQLVIVARVVGHFAAFKMREHR